MLGLRDGYKSEVTKDVFFASRYYLSRKYLTNTVMFEEKKFITKYERLVRPHIFISITSIFMKIRVNNKHKYLSANFLNSESLGFTLKLVPSLLVCKLDFVSLMLWSFAKFHSYICLLYISMIILLQSKEELAHHCSVLEKQGGKFCSVKN